MEILQQQAAEQADFPPLTDIPPMTDDDLPDRPNVREVARWLRKSPNTVYFWARKRMIPCRRVGRSYLFDKAALLEWARPKEAA